MNLKLPDIAREYRPELNGLRAVAVILVLFYHLDFEWMKGGFLGVDVFLVISGYFISRNIIHSLQEGTFTFYGFYTKRLRRLFPALIVTLVLVLVVGYFLLTPANYERLGKSTIFSSLSFSNFFFWSEAGYFNMDSSTKPLLHMWSLSLEEQFYLFWPLVLFLLYKYFKKFIIIFIALFVIISLSLCEFYYSSQPEAVFFLIPFRMFEFLLGASCIWLERLSQKTPKWMMDLLLIIGLVLIGYSGVIFNSHTQMPGLISLVPCVGSMLVIYAGKSPFVSWSLKNKPVELIGKASYSIYLIHWPLVVYYKYYTLNELSLMNQIVLGIVSVALGFLMWHFIENTFRYAKDKRAKLDRIWVAIPTSLLLLCFLSANVWGSDGFPNRFAEEIYMTKEEILANRESYWKDSNSSNKILKGIDGKGHIIMFGNSHAIDIIYALRENGFEAKITSLQTSGRCYNFGTPHHEVDKEHCESKLNYNLNDKNWGLVDAIYMHDHWPNVKFEGLRKILNIIRSKTDAAIYVIGPKMVYKKEVPEIVRASNSIVPKYINEFAQQFGNKENKVFINNALKNEFKHQYYTNNNIHYIDILTLQGGKNLDEFEVVSKDDLKFLYFDKDHLTRQGSKELGKRIKNTYPHLFDVKNLR